MNATQYFPQDYGHPDRNQEETKSSRTPNQPPLADHLDPQLIEESPVNALDDPEPRAQDDVESALQVDTESDVN